MTSDDLISIVTAFNNHINGQDIQGMSGLMAENHVFIDRDGSSHGPKKVMIEGWKGFFKEFPDYRNTFENIVTSGNQVYILGFAYWTEEEPYDPVIWFATLEDGLIAEWGVLEDNPENRKKCNLL
jgi:hypothetical protein